MAAVGLPGGVIALALSSFGPGEGVALVTTLSTGRDRCRRAAATSACWISLFLPLASCGGELEGYSFATRDGLASTPLAQELAAASDDAAARCAGRNLLLNSKPEIRSYGCQAQPSGQYVCKLSVVARCGSTASNIVRFLR